MLVIEQLSFSVPGRTLLDGVSFGLRPAAITVVGISPEYREPMAVLLTNPQAAGKTILLIEHQPDFLQRVGERFLFLEAGRLHGFDTLVELNAAPVAHAALN